MKKTNNKGFTLVELIVVLVILAILAAILVPALVGYIDKARNQQCLTNAQAALVGAQSVAAEKYAKFESCPTDTAGWKAAIDKFTDMNSQNYKVSVTMGGSDKHAGYVVVGFKYTEDGKTAVWCPQGGTDPGSGETVAVGGWYVEKAATGN